MVVVVVVVQMLLVRGNGIWSLRWINKFPPPPPVVIVVVPCNPPPPVAAAAAAAVVVFDQLLLPPPPPLPTGMVIWCNDSADAVANVIGGYPHTCPTPNYSSRASAVLTTTAPPLLLLLLHHISAQHIGTLLHVERWEWR